jgi:hypothetical protein
MIKCERIKTDRLPSKFHQGRVESKWQHKMAEYDDGQWIARCDSRDPPEGRHKISTGNHHSGTAEAEEEGSLERLEDLGKLDEKGCLLDLFAGGAPIHVDFEHVRE